MIDVNIKPVKGRLDSPDKDFYYNQLTEQDNVVSSTECTGLMQRPPEDESEAESYSDIYAVPVPQEVGDAEKKLRK